MHLFYPSRHIKQFQNFSQLPNFLSWSYWWQTESSKISLPKTNPLSKAHDFFAIIFNLNINPMKVYSQEALFKSIWNFFSVITLPISYDVRLICFCLYSVLRFPLPILFFLCTFGLSLMYKTHGSKLYKKVYSKSYSLLYLFYLRSMYPLQVTIMFLIYYS